MLEAVLLRADTAARDGRIHVRLMEDLRQIDALGLPVLQRRPRLQPVRPSDHLVHRPEAELCHQLADVFRHEPEVVLDELGPAREVLPQLGVLRGDADRAGVQMADAHHDAAGDDERGRREAELLGAEQGGDDHVPPGFQLAVDLHDDAVAEPVHHQDLLRFGEAELPRDAAVLDRGERRRPGAAVVAGDQHDVGVRLGHAGRDGADADFGHQLHVDPRVAVRVLQVVNELRQILDRVDVVVRRRRNQRHAGCRVPHARDPRVDLVAGELAALAGLGALRHLDLQIVGVDQVLAGHAEPRRGNLLDRAAARVAVGIGPVAAGSSPPSPVFDLPPSRFIAIAIVSCASWLIDP